MKVNKYQLKKPLGNLDNPGTFCNDVLTATHMQIPALAQRICRERQREHQIQHVKQLIVSAAQGYASYRSGIPGVTLEEVNQRLEAVEQIAGEKSSAPQRQVLSHYAVAVEEEPLRQLTARNVVTMVDDAISTKLGRGH